MSETREVVRTNVLDPQIWEFANRILMVTNDSKLHPVQTLTACMSAMCQLAIGMNQSTDMIMFNIHQVHKALTKLKEEGHLIGARYDDDNPEHRDLMMKSKRELGFGD